MNSLDAYARGLAARGKEPMVFDWNRAAELIVERKPKVASAGLRDDWEWTGGAIWRDGKPVPCEDACTYLGSTWAVPELCLDGEIVECYVMQSQAPEWGPETYWPASALAAAKGERT